MVKMSFYTEITVRYIKITFFITWQC